MGELKGYMAKWKLKDIDRVQGARTGDLDVEHEHDGSDPGASPTTPLAFGSPGRRDFYVRSQSMNGRIQKPSVVRSQSFSGSKTTKLAHRSHHMDSMQGHILNYMKSTGVDQQKVVNVLEKLKEMYVCQGDQPMQLEQKQLDHGSLTASGVSSTPSSLKNTVTAVSSGKTPMRPDDSPRSTISLLKQKFEQLERYKESIQGQQIQIYPTQNFHAQSRASLTPGSSTPGSPLVAPNDLCYSLDEGTAAILPRQDTFPVLSRSGTSGISEDSLKEHVGSSGDSSPASTRGDEAANALLHYMLQPPSPHWHMALNENSGVTGAVGNGSDNVCLGDLLLAERVESQRVVLKKPTPDVVARKTDLSASIEKAMARFPFNRSAKRSSTKLKLPLGWGTGLSLQTALSTETGEPDLSERSKDEVASDSWRKSADSKQSAELPPADMDLDTSLHL